MNRIISAHDMKLIHAYIHEHKAVRDLNISLGGKIECSVANHIVDIRYRHDTTSYYRDYHCSAIIGPNGVGKSSVLDFIESAYFPTDSSGLIIFLDEIEGVHVCQINYRAIDHATPFERHDDFESFAKHHNINLVKINNVSAAQAKLGYEIKSKHPLIQERTLEEYTKTKRRRKRYFENLLSYYRWNRTENNLIEDVGFEFTFSDSTRRMQGIFPINLLTKEAQHEFSDAYNTIENLDTQSRHSAELNNLADYLVKLNVVSILVNLAAKSETAQRKFVLAMLFFYYLKCLHLEHKSSARKCIKQSLEALRYEENWGIFLEGASGEDIVYNVDYSHVDVDEMHARFESLQELLSDIAESISSGRVELGESGSLVVLVEEFYPVSKIVNLASMLPRNILSNVSWGWRGVSTGEMARSHLFSETFNCSADSKHGQCIILIDEADLYLHPEWQRSFLDSYLNFLDMLDWHSPKPQILLTTHSPIIVSDFLPQDIVSLAKDQDGIVRIKESLGFGTNITNLFIDGMHIQSTIGEHSRKAILTLIEKASSHSLNDLDRELINGIGNKFFREYLLEND